MRRFMRLLAALFRPRLQAFASTGPGHGKDVAFQMDDSGGTPRNIAPYVREVRWTVNGQVVDVTGMGESEWRTFLAGLKGATATISGVANDTADVGSTVVLAGAEGSTRSIEYGPLSDGSGRPKFTAEAIVTSVEFNSGVEAESTFSANLQITGAVTVGSYSS